MIVMTEVMAIGGLCWPLRFANPFWGATGRGFLTVRAAGLLALGLSWLNLWSGGEREHAVMFERDRSRVSYERAIGSAWGELEALPVSHRTKRGELRAQILDLEAKLEASPGVARVGVKPVNDVLYRILVLIFTVFFAHRLFAVWARS